MGEKIKRPFVKDTYLAGRALTTLRTMPLLAAELISGMSASDIFMYRGLYGLSNFVGGYLFKEGREVWYKESVRNLLEKTLPKSIVESPSFDRNLDRATGVVACGVEAGISYTIYKLTGVDGNSTPAIPAITGSVMTAIGGGWMGAWIDTYRDANKEDYHKNRSIFSNKKYFPKEPAQEVKKQITDRIDLAIWGSIAVGMYITNYDKIQQGLEQIVQLFN